MGRNPKKRESFFDDAQYMLRLRKAVEPDERLSPEWRKEVCDRLTNLATILVNAPEMKEQP